MVQPHTLHHPHPMLSPTKHYNRQLRPILMAFGALLVLSGVINVLYHSHLSAHEASWRQELLESSLRASHALRPSTSRTNDAQHALHDASVQTLAPKHPVFDETEYYHPPTRRLPLVKSPFLQAPLSHDLWNATAQVTAQKRTRQGQHHVIHNVTYTDLGLEPTQMTYEQALIGREPLVRILTDAGVALDATVLAALPKYQNVVDLYGEGPVILGLDTACAQFQKLPPDDASIGVAGLFNTGTNPLAMVLSNNCYLPGNTHDKAHGMRWQVPWGKHLLNSRKWQNVARHDWRVNKSNVLPIVSVRDPYSWMQSMCRHAYGARWVHNEHHCPNLVATDHDRYDHAGGEELTNHTVKVTVGYPQKHAHFDSLVHFWNEWYQEYVNDPFRIIVRFEDVVFRPRQVAAQICYCVGAAPKQDAFAYVIGEAKWGRAHHDSSNLVTAMLKYGKDQHRLDSLTKADLEFAKQHLNATLLQWLQYPQVEMV